MKQPKRRDREAARTRDDIMEAAARALARAGYAGTTMEDIAQEAGYTVPTLYRYFESKVEIVRGLLARTFQELFATFEEPTPAGLTFRQRLELLLNRQFEFAESRQEAIAVSLSLSPTDDVVDALVKGAGATAEAGGAGGLSPGVGIEFYERRLGEWLKTVAGRSELGGHAPADLATILVGIEIAFFRRWIHGKLAKRLTDNVGFIVSLFFDGVNGTATRPQSRSIKAKR